MPFFTQMNPVEMEPNKTTKPKEMSTRDYTKLVREYLKLIELKNQQMYNPFRV